MMSESIVRYVQKTFNYGTEKPDLFLALQWLCSFSKWVASVNYNCSKALSSIYFYSMPGNKLHHLPLVRGGEGGGRKGGKTVQTEILK